MSVYYLPDNYTEPFRPRRHYEKWISPTDRFEDTEIFRWLKSKGYELNSYAIQSYKDGYRVIPRLMVVCHDITFRCFRVPTRLEMSIYTKMFGYDLLFRDSSKLVLDELPEGEIILDILSLAI